MTERQARRTATPKGGASRPRKNDAAERSPKDRVNVRRGLIEQEIYEQAIQLFAERGFAGTNFQDIADAVGLTRPALYHYVSSKEDLLARLVEENTLDAATSIRAIAEREDLDAVEKIHQIVHANVRRQGEHSARFQLLVRSEASLPESVAATHFESRRTVLRLLTAVVEEGIAARAFRPMEARVAALGLLGMTNWVAWWFRADHGDDLEAISRQLADMAVAGLTMGTDGRGPASSPAAALKMVRADLIALEEMLEKE